MCTCFPIKTRLGFCCPDIVLSVGLACPMPAVRGTIWNRVMQEFGQWLISNHCPALAGGAPP